MEYAFGLFDDLVGFLHYVSSSDWKEGAGGVFCFLPFFHLPFLCVNLLSVFRLVSLTSSIPSYQSYQINWRNSGLFDPVSFPDLISQLSCMRKFRAFSLVSLLLMSLGYLLFSILFLYLPFLPNYNGVPSSWVIPILVPISS